MTIKEIAKLAGVSISTVSKIVNDKADNINVETRNRVLKIVKEYNYTPYGGVKNISNARTFIIGVLLRSASQTNRMLNGIMDVAQEHGYSILLYDSLNDMQMELKHITSLCKNKVDGVIWEPVDGSSLQNMHHFSDYGIPFCTINASALQPSYYIDFAQMGYALTQKLIDYKHTSIACFMKPKSLRSKLVFEGFKRCLFDNEIPYTDDMKIMISDKDYYSKISTQGITGIVSTHFASALALYEQMDRLHCYIPSDLSLVSLQDDVREAITFPRISSMKIPYQEFGMYICNNLIAKCEKNEFPNKTLCFFKKQDFLHEDSIQPPSSLRMKKIVVVGSINMDISFNVDELPHAGKAITIHSSSVTLGGKGANQAIGATKLGREVSLIGKIGNDYESAMIYDMLKKENLLTQGIRRDMKAETGKAYVYVKNNAESAITLLPGANAMLSTADIQKHQHLFKNSGFCLISTELPFDTVLEATVTAKKQDVKVILKPATLNTFPDSLAKYIDIFVPNKIEASILCPYEDNIEKQAVYFLNKGISTVIITLGENGCYLKTDNISQYFNASDFVSIDTTGGADAFIAALASYLIEGYQIENAIQIATYAAGFCVSRQGVVPALIDRNSLENHIRMVNPKLLL